MTDSRLAYYVRRGETTYDAAADKDHEVWVSRQALTDDGEPDGVFWEFCFKWHDFGSNGEGLQVKVFDDAWQVFTELPELWVTLAERHTESTSAMSMQPGDLTKLLDSLGFTDVTQRAEPF